MTLQQRIAADLTASMKARDRERTSTLRLLVAALKNQAIALGRGPQGDLTDPEVEGVLASEKKRRDEAAESFANAGRDEQAAKERAEADLIATYLPEQLTDDELAVVIDEVCARVAPAGMKDMGRVMQAVMAEVGKRADGGRVSAEVKARLTAMNG